MRLERKQHILSKSNKKQQQQRGNSHHLGHWDIGGLGGGAINITVGGY
jgi:hypothetical protein